METSISNIVKFSTKIEDDNIFIHDKKAFAVCVNADPDDLQITGSAVVLWSIEPEYKESHIKCMNQGVRKVEFSFDFADTTDHSGTLTFTSDEEGWKLTDSLDFNGFGYCCPEAIHIDFEKKTIEVV